MKNMVRIAYVLGSPFPTRKAYGVTTRETLKALQESLYKVKIFCPQGTYVDDDFESVMNTINSFDEIPLVKILTHIGKLGKTRFNHFSWRFGLFLIITRNILIIRAKIIDINFIKFEFVCQLCKGGTLLSSARCINNCKFPRPLMRIFMRITI